MIVLLVFVFVIFVVVYLGYRDLMFNGYLVFNLCGVDIW